MEEEQNKETMDADKVSIVANANIIKVGDLVFESYDLDTSNLAGLVIQFLKDKSVQKYLGLIKQEEQCRKATYVD